MGDTQKILIGSMKSLASEAAHVLSLNAEDLAGIEGFEQDAALIGFIARKVGMIRHYLCPVGGEVDRRRLMEDGHLPVSECLFPQPEFTLEFHVSEKGFIDEGSPAFTIPSFMRMALVQDLRDASLLMKWRQFLPESQSILSQDAQHSVLVLPINRIADPHLERGPGNRGWMSGWMGALIDMRQPSAKIESHGDLIRLSLEQASIPMGKTGELTLAQMVDQGMDAQTEIHRETALEILATLDFGVACSRSTAHIRRYEKGGLNVWRAGDGPLVPPRLLS